MKAAIVPVVAVERRIMTIRGQRVILDADLADLYGVTTPALNQAVRRNEQRFPQDFRFQLTEEEDQRMRSQIVIASKRNVRYLPWAFTEHGAIMAAMVLRSAQATEMSVLVVRAFVKLRQMAAEHAELGHQLQDIRVQLRDLRDRDHDRGVQIDMIMETLDELMKPPAPPPPPPRRKIGFKWET